MANLDSPQWKRAKQTSLWKRTLGSDDEDVKPLRDSFLDARKNAAFLLDKIRPDFPNLTIHDITHVDSLWSVADAIIGEDYPINPLEGYVLGIAFLIHDAALSYYSVGGKEKLRNTIEWRDAHAEGPGDKSEEEFEKECDFIAIRALHADNAKNLLSESFKDQNGITINIHGNDSYLNHYGNLIGRIAASHHWDIDDVESKLKNQVNPMSGMPRDWKINRQKLACILRCADAGHIDDGRAPDSIYKSLDVNGVSRNHWESQNHLAQVCEDENDKTKLCITSSYPFKKEEFAAWNVAYDAVRIFDEELKKSNNLLIANHIKEFPHNGVSGANSKEDLAKYIETDDWQPCNFGVHTSNIKYLIETLGGSKLYGEDNMLLVALRELIQNARDAIHARQKLEDSFNNGKITVRLIEEDNNRFIEVEDNGIGMSMDCIKHNLLDFGNSYWKSPLSKYENPGLRSKGFTSIGKFGIGFYSVFMVAESVEVRTKRYNKAADEAKKIEFPKGLTLSPIISNDTMSASVSTIVRFELKDDINLTFSTSAYIFSLRKALTFLVAALDTNVYYEEQDKSQRIHTDIYSPDFDRAKWLADLCIPCPKNIDEIASKLEFLTDENDRRRGLLLPPEYESKAKYQNNIYMPSIKTIGGLATSLAHDDTYCSVFIGYLDGKENSISRNQMNLDEPLMACLRAWTKEKYQENYGNFLIDSSIAKAYSKLVDFCNLEDTLVKDNIRRLYENKGSRIDVESIRGLMDIHYYLYVGIDPDAGNFKLSHTSVEVEDMDTILYYLKSGKTLDDLLSSYSLEYEEYRIQEMFVKYYDVGHTFKERLKSLLRINDMPASSDKEIIKKYGEYMKVHPFDGGNEETLGVWVNLMLDKVSGKMIDWRKVNKTRLYVTAHLGPVMFGEYLKTCLSSTYLDEILNN